MPLNVFRSFSGSQRVGDGDGGGGRGGFFQRNFRRGRSGEGMTRDDSSIRRQVLTRAMSRSNSEDSEMALPVLPPGGPHRSAEGDDISNSTDTFDGESYVEIPRDAYEPSVHHAPSFHGSIRSRGAPAMQPEGHDARGPSYEPSIHHFAVAPSAEEDTYSDMTASPVPQRARGFDPLPRSIESPRIVDGRDYGHPRGHDRPRDMGSRRGHGHPRDLVHSPSTSDSRDLVYPPEFDSPRSSDSRDLVRPREFGSPHSSDSRDHVHPRELDSPHTSSGYSHDDVRPRRLDSPHSSSGHSHDIHPRGLDSPHSSSSHGRGPHPRHELDSPIIPDRHHEPHRTRELDSPRSSESNRHNDHGFENPRYAMGGYAGRDIAHDPVRVIARSDTEDSRNGDLEERRLHPAFRGPSHSHASHSSSSSGTHRGPPPRGPHQRSRDASALPIRDRAIPIDPRDYGHRRHEPPRPQRRVEREPDTYYIIPPGTNVIFQDENGKEIHRVGDFSGKPRRPYKEKPIVVQDEFGREIYRTPGYGNPAERVSYHDHLGALPNVILVDHNGQQIPLTNSSSGSFSSGRSDPDEGSIHSGSSGTIDAHGSGRYR